MANTANGSTLSFVGSSLAVVDIQYEVNGAEIDISRLGSARKEYEPGLDDIQITVVVLGYVPTATIDKGDIGDVVYTPAGGTAETVSDCIVMSRSLPATVDGRAETTLVFRPTEPQA